MKLPTEYLSDPASIAASVDFESHGPVAVSFPVKLDGPVPSTELMPLGEMSGIKLSGVRQGWEQLWGNQDVQHVLDKTLTGKLLGSMVRTAGRALAAVSDSRYDFAEMRTLNPVEQREAFIDTVLNAALLPLGAPTVGLKAELTAARTLAEANASAGKLLSNGVGKYGRFESADEFAAEAFTRYLRYTDEAYVAAQNAYTKRRLIVPDGVSPQTSIGQRTDAFARIRMSNWLKNEGIAEGSGEVVQLNRWLRDPSGSGLYRIPDVRIPDANLIMDGTISYKWQATPQVADFYRFSGSSNIAIVRPTVLGGPYSLVPGQ